MIDISDVRLPLIGVGPKWIPSVLNEYIHELTEPDQSCDSKLFRALTRAGGMPVVIPVSDDPDLVARYVELCDAFVIPGGHDVNPRLWGESDEGMDPRILCPERDVFETLLIHRVLEVHKPLLAICRGAQILNVSLGGSLCMDVPNCTPRAGTVLWRHASILNDPAHPVEVKPDTLLARCVGGRDFIQVNSSHHCCVERLGDGVVLVGEATDGIPEAIEVPSEAFCLGVQWHPEQTWDKLSSDFGLFEGLVQAARESGRHIDD